MENISMEKYMKEQIEKVTSHDYRKKAAIGLNKKKPTNEEVVEYYIESGDAEKYNKEHPHY